MPKATNHAWSVEQETFLRDLALTPASYGEITKSFNARFGTHVSRSAILGKCDRMGIRGSKVSSKSGPRAGNRIRRTKADPAVHVNRKNSFGTIGGLSRPPLAGPVDPLREENDRGPALTRSKSVNVDTMFDATPDTKKSFLDLRRDECKWPATSDASMACGAKITIGAYCTRHAQIAYRTMPTRSRNAKVLAGAGFVDERRPGHDLGATLALPKFLESSAPSIDPGDGDEEAGDD